LQVVTILIRLLLQSRAALAAEKLGLRVVILSHSRWTELRGAGQECG
jgi:hypothetical protein